MNLKVLWVAAWTVVAFVGGLGLIEILAPAAIFEQLRRAPRLVRRALSHSVVRESQSPAEVRIGGWTLFVAGVLGAAVLLFFGVRS